MGLDGRHGTSRRWLVLLIVLALVVVACGSEDGEATTTGGAGATTTEGETGTSAPGSDTTAPESDFSGQELVVWAETEEAESLSVAYEQLDSEFAEQFDVTVTREVKSFDDLQATVVLALGQSDGPDVAAVNQSRSAMGLAVEGGLLLDLTPFATERGWFDDFGAQIHTRQSFSEDGLEWGTGNLYGLSPQVSFLAWYYNKDKFSELGLVVPQTMEELESILAALKDAGETPIAFGNLEGFPILHTYWSLMSVQVPSEDQNDLIYGRGDATFDRSEFVDAAARIQRWAESGYFSEAFQGISYGDATGFFAEGEGGLLHTGTWVLPDYDPETFGLFLTPSSDPDEFGPQVASQQTAFAVRADSDVQELALEFMDFMVSERAAKVLAEAGGLPMRTPPADTAVPPLAAEAQAAWAEIIGNDAIGEYMGGATPTMLETHTNASQQLLPGEITPEEFVAIIEADYRAYLDSLSSS